MTFLIPFGLGILTGALLWSGASWAIKIRKKAKEEFEELKDKIDGD